jgi:hypothetical protein
MPKTYNKFVIGNTTYLDISSDTVTADTVLNGYTAHNKNGESIIGNVVLQTYYTGSTTPSSSLGNNGDIYLKE